jgi:hypothetical protein
MRVVFMWISYFIQVKEFNMCLQLKDEHFHHRDHYTDLIKDKQVLIDNNYSGQRKLMSYFVWPYDQFTSGHANIQNQIMCRYFCIN